MSKPPRSWLSEFLSGRRRIELGDFGKAFFLRGVGAGDEGAAYLGAVPAGDDTETQRFFGLDMTGGKNLHLASLVERRWRCCRTLRGGFDDAVRLDHCDATASACCASARSTELMEIISIEEC